MDKQKEIEKMAFSVCKVQNEYESITSCEKCGYTGICRNQEYAEEFIKKGYGDVRAAVKEFADKVLSKIYSALDYCPNDYDEAYHECFSDLRDYINDLVKEMCGDEVPKNDKA